MLHSPDDRQKMSLSFQLDFPVSNNEAEYEALVIGLSLASNLEIKRICVRGDSRLVVKQMDGEYAVKEPSLVPYRSLVQKLESAV